MDFLKVVLYIRVSTQEQAMEGYSINEQQQRLAAYCTAKNWDLVHSYVDPGFSGSNINRPAMNQLIDDAKQKKFDAVLVYKLDRLSRSQKDTLYLIEDVFLKNQIDFVSMNENFDTSTAFGRAMIGILSVFAQLEREQIKERTQMGKDARAKEGLWHGGGFEPIGYDYIDGHLHINEYEAMQVREIYALFLRGTPIDRICRMMQEKGYTTKYGNWTHDSAVRSVLLTKLYAGLITWKGNEYPGQHDAIVSLDLFERVQKQYALISWSKNSQLHKPRPFQAKHLLTTLLYCGKCGARYFAKGNTSTRNGEKYTLSYYTCYSRGKTKKSLIKDHRCKNRTYRVERLNAMIIDEVKKLSFDANYLEQLVQTSTPSPNNQNRIVENRIDDIDKQITRLVDLYQLGTLSTNDLNHRIEQLNHEKQHLHAQLVPVDDASTTLDLHAAKQLLMQVDEVFTSKDEQVQKELIHALIDRIEILDDDITIFWAFV